MDTGWISSRVLCRHYPESTSIETYRIYEWAHFLKITQQLPQDAIATPFNSEVNASITREGLSHPLSDNESKKSTKFFREKIPEYNELFMKYNEKR